MLREDSLHQDEGTEHNRTGFRSHNLSLVVGASGSESSEGLDDMRSRMQSFAIADECVMPSSTVFIDDSDVILPSTSQTNFLTDHTAARSINDQAIGINMNEFVKDFFSNSTRFFHSSALKEAQTNFIEEIFAEKPPKILNDYLFGNVIGEGSYSKVKEVLHIRSLMRRAVKIIKDKRLRKIPAGELNVQREIEVLQRLDHSNVVKVVDIFRIEEKQKLYIVMEFCVCSLQQMLDNCEERMLPEFQANIYFTQLLDGLDFLHAKRIIHKDIKPGNLLLSLDGILKICDLGVAELLTPEIEDDWCTLVQGTPKFQPPEIVSGTQRRFRGSLVDIWACGITLYNIVSGQYPFKGDVIMKLFENIINNPLEMPFNVHLSDELKILLFGMLQKNPEKRWNSVAIRASKWFSSKHSIDNSRIVHVPAIKDIPAHRPLGIYHCLEQLYGWDEQRRMSGEVADTQYKDTNVASAFHPSTLNLNRQESAMRDSDQQQQRNLSGQICEHEPFLDATKEQNTDLKVVTHSLNNNDENGDGNIINNDGIMGEHIQQGHSQMRRKVNVERLRQILFITLCSLIVLASVLVLILML